MLISRRSILTGIVRILELPVTQEQYDRWKGGEMIQDCMPHLTTDQREFLISGCIPNEWENGLRSL